MRRALTRGGGPVDDGANILVRFGRAGPSFDWPEIVEIINNSFINIFDRRLTFRRVREG